MRYAYKYQDYAVASVVELEQLYLRPVKTASEGRRLTQKGESVTVTTVGGRVERFRMTRFDRALRGGRSAVVIALFFILYALAFGMALEQIGIPWRC